MLLAADITLPTGVTSRMRGSPSLVPAPTQAGPSATPDPTPAPTPDPTPDPTPSDDDDDDDGDGDGGPTPTDSDEPGDPLTDPNDQISEAPSIRVGDSNRQVLSDDMDVDMFEIEVDGGDIIGFDIDNVLGNRSLDTLLRLFDAAGNELADSDDDAAPGEADTLEAYIEFEFPASGLFYVGVSGIPNEDYDPVTGAGDEIGDFGTYVINVVQLGELDLNDQITEARDIDLDEDDEDSVEGKIDFPYDVDMYRIRLNEFQSLVATVDILGGTNFSPLIRLFDSTGEEIAVGDAATPITFINGGLAGYYFIGISAFENNDYDELDGTGDTAGATGRYRLNLDS